MSQFTHPKTTALSRFKLKPLLMAIPVSVLAACANTPENETPDTYNEPVAYEEAAFEDTHTSEPDLVSADTPTKNSIKEEDAPMTVLVIENPELLAKLGRDQPLPQETLAQININESTLRPSKRVFHFGFNQASLSEEDIELVEKHADYLNNNPELNVTIHGHTDTQGNPDYNLKLSEQRALMLVSQLKKFGINKSRIKTIGWGGNYPLINSLNFSENRRIEIEYSETNYAANH